MKVVSAERGRVSAQPLAVVIVHEPGAVTLYAKDNAIRVEGEHMFELIHACFTAAGRKPEKKPKPKTKMKKKK